VEEEAEIVRRIYKDFLNGQSTGLIARRLMKDGIPTPAGKKEWRSKGVESILTNEKFCGNAILQKVYKPHVLSKRSVKNTGALDQIFVKNSHPGIVSPEEFDAVQEIFQQRKASEKYYGGKYLMSGRIICSECGHVYARKVWHSTDAYKKYVWQCSAKYERGTHCKTPHFKEDEIKARFIKAVNEVLRFKEKISANVDEIKEILSDRTDIDIECAKKDTAFEKRYDELQAQYDAKVAEGRERFLSIHRLDAFRDELLAHDGQVTEFYESQWLSLLDHVTVYSKFDVRFKFKNGAEIT